MKELFGFIFPFLSGPVCIKINLISKHKQFLHVVLSAFAQSVTVSVANIYHVFNKSGTFTQISLLSGFLI